MTASCSRAPSSDMSASVRLQLKYPPCQTAMFSPSEYEAFTGPSFSMFSTQDYYIFARNDQIIMRQRLTGVRKMIQESLSFETVYTVLASTTGNTATTCLENEMYASPHREDLSPRFRSVRLLGFTNDNLPKFS